MCDLTGLVLFVDGDGSDRLDRAPDLLDPIRTGRADFVHGSRVRDAREPGAMSQQIVAGYLAGWLLRLTQCARFTDMLAFRAIRRDALARLGLRDETYGWSLGMLMRVAAANLRCEKSDVGQRPRRGGASKVSGDWRVGLRAVWIIGTTGLRLARELAREKPSAG